MSEYLRNFSLWLRGHIWLWTRRESSVPDAVKNRGICYKRGWGPLRFLLVYDTTYLLGTLAGYGVVSLSRAWYDRRDHARFARFMTRLLNFVFPGEHGVFTGPRLWGSTNLRD